MRLIIIFLTVFSLCLSSANAQSPSSASSVAAKACGKDQVDFDVRTENPPQSALQPEPGKALIFVISQVWKPIRVGMDGAWIGANGAHSYMSIPVNPGEHHVCVEGKFFLGSKGKQVSLTSVDVEPGKTYFLQARLIPTWQGDTKASDLFEFQLINPDEGKFLLEKLPYSTSQPKKK